ncbi:phosphotransferase [Dyella silvae]|uniref:phosphotransferase n=1 Tax=Dyella silvae TaxID=2994424 RepID=UPI002264C2D8|nr:phosphotransferase [Dyella silvae]
MLAKTDWAHLIPHQGAMALLDAVVTWDDATIHAITDVSTLRNHPLRSENGLHAVHLAEHGAQAIAVHGALLARLQGIDVERSGGRLVSLRDVQIDVEYIDDSRGRLDVYAERLYADDSGAQYAFRILQAARLLVSGRAAVLYTQD